MSNRSHDKALAEELPLSIQHAPLLEIIIKEGNTLGGAALLRLADLTPLSKDRLLSMLYEARMDHNFARNSVAKLLKPLLDIEDIDKIRQIADSMPERDANPSYRGSPSGFVASVADMLMKFDLSTIKKYFLRNQQPKEVTAVVKSVIKFLFSQYKTTESLNLASEFLEYGDINAANVFGYFDADDIENIISWKKLSYVHIDTLLNAIKSSHDVSDYGAVHALSIISKRRPDLGVYASAKCLDFTGLKKALALFAINNNNQSIIFNFLTSINESNINQIIADNNNLFPFLARIKLDWSNQSSLFTKLFHIRNTELLYALLYTNNNLPAFNQNYGTIGIITIDSLESFIDWLMSITDQSKQNSLSHHFGILLLFHTDISTQNKVVSLFNTHNEAYKHFISRWILNNRRDLTINNFSEQGLSYLLADLAHTDIVASYNGHLLEHIATEEFTTERILPLLQSVNENLVKNVTILLRKIGAKHGRRYF
ncbi:MAG: hypothetical protein EOP45_10445 [Sphingobacteriaceae bacterium]|nr:MAG: hypothetical protein EOP45_10445 [Sphingobacteriaceae bacterium]